MKEKLFLKQIDFLIAIFAIFSIGFLNFAIIRNIFLGDFNQNIASIEISYIQMAKFWASGGSPWQPLWYLGYPWHVFYTPLLPFLEVILHFFLSWNFAHAYRVIVGIGYILVPISLFLFVWQLTKSKSGAYISAIVYSLVPSLVAYLMPEVANDNLSGVMEPRRFTILVRWGEGPHTLALAFVPLFGFFLSKFTENRKFWFAFAASVMLGLVALTNAVALWAAFLLFIAFFLREVAKKTSDIIPLLKGYFLIAFLTYGLVAFWYNLPFISTFFREGGGALGNWTALLPWGLLALAFIFALIFIVVRLLMQKIEGGVFSVFWFLMLFAIVYIYYASNGHLEYAPQALRLNTEADMALSILIGALVSFLFTSSLRGFQKIKYLNWLAAGIVFVVPLFAIYVEWGGLISDLPRFALPISASRIGDVKNTPEFQVAEKLKSLVSNTQQRVVAPGNYGFWLDYFEPVPQLRGALFQSSTHFWPDHIYYQLTNGMDANISLAWLKIANVGKLVYTTQESRETYKDYKVEEGKFNSVLSKIEEDKGDIYYNVPLKNDLMAKVVSVSEISKLKKPLNAIDSKPIFDYVSWIEEKSDHKLNVQRPVGDKFHISGDLSGQEAILIQETYDKGWYVKGGGWRIIKDPMDFMVLEPGKNGKFEIDLLYSKPLSVYFGYLITFLTFGLLAKSIIGRKKENKSL